MDSATFYIGPNHVQIEGRILHVKLIGHYLADHAQEVMTLADQIYRQYGIVFLIHDLSQSIPPEPAVRKLLATWPVAGPYPALIYGAGALQRAAMQLILSANRLLSRANAPDVHFFPSEAAARAWIAKHPQGGAAST